METLRDLTRLNLALEFVSDCAGLTSVGAAIDLVGQKLRWIVDFDECALVLQTGDSERWWSMGSGDESLSAGPHDRASEAIALLRQSVTNRMPAVSGTPLQAMAHPMGSTEMPVGALSIRRIAGLTYRDFRFLHHVAAGLGSALQRLSQSEQLLSALTRTAEQDRVARDKARADSEAKDAFVAMLAHELRNPLAPIFTAVELLRRDAGGTSPKVVDIVDRQARQLKRLVDDLLDTTRLTTGKIDLQRGPVDLRTVAADAAETVTQRLADSQQSLTLALPPSAVMVDGDAARLTQVLTNLAVNASKFSPPGSAISIRIEASAQSAFLEVEDNGIGIESSMLDAIFEMFVQGRRQDGRSPDGLGLGLGVARALIELHGGTIEATSDGPGLGSIFRLTLPKATAIDNAQVETDSATDRRKTPSRTEPRRILLVDDNVDAALTTGDLLSCAGHSVAVAHGPFEALAEALSFRPEIAILDVGLPVMDGYALAQELREQLGADAPRFVALSGYGQAGDRQRSAESGFDAHLVKPVDLAELLRSVDAACDLPGCGAPHWPGTAP